MIKRSLRIGWVTAWAAVQAAVAAEPIVITAQMPITGRFAFGGRHLDQGLTDYLTYVNEQGGVNGTPIEYHFEDTGYDLRRAVATFKKQMAKHHPVMNYGESTGQGKALAPEINDRYRVVYGSTSFSRELSDRHHYPYMFVSGPTYDQQFGILLKYIAAHPKANDRPPRVAFFYSDTEFGRDPIPAARAQAEAFGIQVVTEVITPVGAIDTTSQVLELRRHRPDYCIFQGYVVPPIPSVIRGARDFGLDTTFMGTFWTMSNMLLDQLGPDGEGFMGVNPYAYWHDQDVPMIQIIRDFNRRHHPDVDHRPNYYMQGWFTGMVFVKLAELCQAEGLPVTGENLKDMIPRIHEWDTQGFAGTVSFRQSNASPVGRVYVARDGKFMPASDWMYLNE